MKDLVKKLHPHEKRILLALKELDEATSNQIATHAKLPVQAVHKASLWAKLKGFVKYEETRIPKISLTAEGETYTKEGLPEKKLLILISKGKKTILELKNLLPNLDIALGWAKRKGWIEIVGNKIRLTPLGKEAIHKVTPLEKTLKEGETLAKDVIDELKGRGLIKLKEISHKVFTLTPKGKRITSRIEIKEEIGQLTPEIIKSAEWKQKGFRAYDITQPVPTLYSAKLHPYTQFLLETKKKLITLGFQEVKGPLVELEFWNCDALFMPQDHPARGIHDIFELKNPKVGEVEDKRLLKRVANTHKNGWITDSKGWGYWNLNQTLKLILRSQTTSVSMRTLAKHIKLPAKFFTIDRCFRPDIIDASHFIEFDQCEGIVVGKNLNLKHLLGYLKIFGKEIAGADDVRFKPSYFPFTEPSVGMDCLVNGKWIETAGAGIFRPEVTEPLGVNASVLAWGIGFARLAMIKLGIDDIRDLFSSDLNWLRKRPMMW